MGNYILLDTETTGLDDGAEIVEVSVIDDEGNVLLNTLVKPRKPIPASATAIHGITNAMVATAPTYDQIHHQLIALLAQNTCYIYNASYDMRLMRQSAALYGIAFDSRLYQFHCVMEDYADQHNGGYWSTLSGAYCHARMMRGTPQIALSAHRALADCLMTLEVSRFLEDTTTEEH
ncbi:DNA polymerase III subunit epsilon [Ralstonia solanacearum]|nr:DNA polymerase III subunit epsilon [Ralstonia solanacearum]